MICRGRSALNIKSRLRRQGSLADPLYFYVLPFFRVSEKKKSRRAESGSEDDERAKRVLVVGCVCTNSLVKRPPLSLGTDLMS